MKRMALALLTIALAACATTHGTNATGNAAPPSAPAASQPQFSPSSTDPAVSDFASGEPVDFIGKLQSRFTANEKLKAFMLSDLDNAYSMAQAAGEQDGISCIPTFIACINGDTSVCGERTKVVGLFSLKEAALTGKSARSVVIPVKLHHDCAAWFTDGNMVAKAILGTLR